MSSQNEAFIDFYSAHTRWALIALTVVVKSCIYHAVRWVYTNPRFTARCRIPGAAGYRAFVPRRSAQYRGWRPVLDPRIQDVVLVAPKFISKADEELFLRGFLHRNEKTQTLPPVNSGGEGPAASNCNNSRRPIVTIATFYIHRYI